MVICTHPPTQVLINSETYPSLALLYCCTAVAQGTMRHMLKLTAVELVICSVCSVCRVLNQNVYWYNISSINSCVPGINSVSTCLRSVRYRLPLLCCTTQLGKARTRRDIMEGWIIEGNDYQPGLLEMLKAARTPEVGVR